MQLQSIDVGVVEYSIATSIICSRKLFFNVDETQYGNDLCLVVFVSTRYQTKILENLLYFLIFLWVLQTVGWREETNDVRITEWLHTSAEKKTNLTKLTFTTAKFFGRFVEFWISNVDHQLLGIEERTIRTHWELKIHKKKMHWEPNSKIVDQQTVLAMFWAARIRRNFK